MTNHESFGASELPTPARPGPPWEQGGPLPNRYLETVKGVLLDPVTFFSRMRREGGLGPPLTFGLLGFTIGLLVSFLFQFLISPFGVFPGLPPDVEFPAAGLAGLILMLVVVPCLAIVGFFLGSGIYHLLLMLLGGARYGYETTFRVVAYTQGSTGLLNVIPVCGGFAAAIWGIVATVIGLARAHETSTGKAAAAVLIPIALCCVAIVIFFGALMALFAGALRNIE
jgi:hypothetical protein